MHCSSGFQALQSGLFAEFANGNSDWDGIVEIYQHLLPAIALGHFCSV